MSNKNKVAIIGAGMMGPGIAARAALAGHPTVLIDVSQERAEAGVEKALAAMQQLLDNGLAESDQTQRAIERLVAAPALAPHLADTFLIIEAVSENLALKQQIFTELDALAPADVIIASNTSGLRITDIAARTAHPERTVTTHFWFPAHLVPLVEVVMGDRTAEAVAVKVKELLIGWGKAPVIVRKDLPGQLANRILQAILREATNIVGMGLATPEDVDTAVKMGMGIRFPAWGPLEHIDAVGLDLALSVQKDVLPGLCNDPQPVQSFCDLVEAGHLGHKTGRGFYDWRTKDMAALSAGRDRFIIEALRVLQAGEGPE